MKNRPSKKHIKYFGIVLSAVAILTVVATTLTWYAHNQVVKATNVKMKVTASPNLVIADSVQGIVDRRITDKQPFTITCEGVTAKKMTPATHDLTTFPVNASISQTQTGLKCVTNLEIVDLNTGLAGAGSTLDYKTVPVHQDLDDKLYYYDYTVYVASAAAPWPNKKIAASATLASSSTATTYTACSVDFIINGYYKGTISPAISGSPVVIYEGEIPYNEAISGDKYIPITMRCYFDGELKKPGGTSAYVNTTDAENATDLMNVDITLSAVD